MIERKGCITPHQRGIVYGTGGLSPVIAASDWKGATKIMIDEFEIGQTEERRHNMVELVPRTDGMSNTLTGVARDNLLIKKDIVVEGELDGNVIQDKQVYGESGVAPTCMGAGGSGSKTKVLVEGCELGDGEAKPMHTPGRAVKRQNGPRLGEDTSFTVTAADKDGIASNENGRLRIRYLTPRECLRLQAFPDDAIDKMIPVLSKSALYKVAGNSIAVCCLKAIFKGIYIDKTFRKTGRQVSLNRWF